MISKKPKVKPVVANKNARKMEKMLKKMTIDDSKMSTLRRKQKAMDDSSSDEEDEEMAAAGKKEKPEPTAEELQDMATRLSQFESVTAEQVKPMVPKRAKPLPRSYYQELKKRLRRKLRAGLLPDISKIDQMLIDAEMN